MSEEPLQEKKYSIVIIDDDRHINHALNKFVELLGYSVSSAYDGNEGWDMVRSRIPDLVLLDVVMPSMSGFEVCRRIRMNEATMHIPVIMLTSLGDRQDRIMGLEAGCDEFAQKPVSFEELKARIHSLLKINYYRSKADQREKFERIVQSVHDGIFVLDATYRVLDANPYGLRLLSLDHESTKGIDLIDYLNRIFVIDASLDLKNPHDKTVFSFEMSRQETEHTKAFFLLARLHYFYEPSGSISSSMLTLHDITEFKKEEIIKRNFISLISHKLLTPLAIITGNQEILRTKGEQTFSAEQKKLMDIICRRTGQLKGLIEQLLLFVEICENSFNQTMKTVNLSDMVPKLSKRYFSDKQDHAVAFVCEKKSENLATTIIPKHLEVIVYNLLDNAVKHNDNPVKKVRIELDMRNDMCGMTVEDNGPGIPPEEYDNIFNAFYQVEKYFTGNKEGVGLGLSLVKQLVERYGGVIEVFSKLGQGSSFRVCFPHNVRFSHLNDKAHT